LTVVSFTIETALKPLTQSMELFTKGGRHAVTFQTEGNVV